LLFIFTTIGQTTMNTATEKLNALFDAIKKGEIKTALNIERVNVDRKNRDYQGYGHLRNWRDKQGHNLLHKVCEHAPRDPKYVTKLTKLITHLLALGISINAATLIGRETPLHCCCLMGNFHLAQILLENHANPDVRDKDGDTPLHLVQMFNVGEENVNWTKLLKRYSNYAEDDIRNNAGLTPKDIHQKWNPYPMGAIIV
jgi:hypothetical protein